MLNAQQARKRERRETRKRLGLSLSLSITSKQNWKTRMKKKLGIFIIMHNRHYLSFASILSTCFACQRPIHIFFSSSSLSLLSFVIFPICAMRIKKMREENKKKKEKKIFFDHDHHMIMIMIIIIMTLMNISTRLL